MSLLKRIEQGQGGNSSSGGQSSDNQGGEGSRLSSLQARRVNAPTTSPQAGSYFDLKTRVQNKLLSELDPSMDITRTDDVRRTIQDLFEQILAEENIVLSRPNGRVCSSKSQQKSLGLVLYSLFWKMIPLPKLW